MEHQEFLQCADKLPEGMLLLTSHGEILAVNRRATQLLQILAKDLVNKNLSPLTNFSEAEIIQLLKPITRSRSPAAVSIKLLNKSSVITSGFLYTPATGSALPHVILRIQEYQLALSQFHVLNEEVKKQKKLMRLLTQSRDNLEEDVQKRTAELSIALDEAKRNELALFEKEERLSLATESNGVGIWDLDLHTQQLVWDDSMFTLYQIRRDDFPSHYDAWTTSLHRDDCERGKQEVQDAIAGKKPLDTEFRVCWPDGEIRHIKAMAKVFYDDNGMPARMLGANIDITDRKQDEEKLRKSEELWKFALEGSGDGAWEYNFQTRVNNVSPQLMQMLGLNASSKTVNLLNDWIERLHPDCQAITHERFQAVVDKKTNSYVVEQQVRCEDGNYKWLLTRGMVVSHSDDGKPQRMVGTVSDISSSKQEALVKLQLAASVFSHAREAIIIADASNSIIEVNDTFTDITGYTHSEVIGKNPRFLQSPSKQSPEFYTAMWHVINTSDYWTGEVWNRRKNGEVYPANITVSAVKNDGDKVSHYVVLFSDITRLKEHQSQLERMANYDDLTKLPNRALLRDRLTQAIVQSQRHQKSLAVVFMDLDGFKAVNDNYGHDVGDELLITISKRMKDALRQGDTLARFGGDEFVAVLGDLTKVEDCEPLIQRLLEATAAPVRLGDNIMQVSASIGITLYPQDSADEDQLVRHADQAMYLAKQAGKNCYQLFDTDQDEAISIQRKSIDDISSALERREFELYYQPKVNMRSGEVTGLEALIRWQHPIRGLIPPLDFLLVIEGHNITLDLGRWVIDTALTQISQWQSMGIHIPISVNISPYQLQQNDFVSQLAALLADHPEVPPNHLELEILESSALSDISQVTATMNACHDLGVLFALDDFGTGYSSLTHLRHLPAHLIKIDQSFVRDILVDLNDFAIVEAVIGLAKTFKRNVIAEGVETIAHGSLLLQLGCELAQGYGIARPMPAAEIPAWIDKWRPDDAWQFSLETDIKKFQNH